MVFVLGIVGVGSFANSCVDAITVLSSRKWILLAVLLVTDSSTHFDCLDKMAALCIVVLIITLWFRRTSSSYGDRIGRLQSRLKLVR